MKSYNVPIKAVSYAAVEMEGESLKDAIKNVLSLAEEHGWVWLCEEVYDYAEANIDWEEIGNRLNRDIEMEERQAQSEGSLKNFV